MKLRCASVFKNEIGVYQPGDIFDIADAEGAYLLACSPDSFKRIDVASRPDPTAAVDEAEPDPTAAVDEAVTAHSAEMASGLVAMDRRARGGRVRSDG